MRTDREQLIEKAAQAIYEAGVTRSFADADWWEIEQAELEARAALDVFEEAHAPTADERTPKAYRDGYHAGKEVGLSATAAMGEIATLRQERDYWRKRYEALEGEPTDDERSARTDPHARRCACGCRSRGRRGAI